MKSIVRSIVGQQISVKAAVAIFDRLTQKIDDDWSVDTISKLTEEDMVEIGLSIESPPHVLTLELYSE